MFALTFCLMTVAGFSQTPSKPAIFANYPDQIDCSPAQFSNAFNFTEGQAITLSFPSNFTISGRVISNEVKYSNLQTMTIQVPDFDNAVFHLSKQINDDNSVTYVGRIMNKNAADGYRIIKDAAGNYKFQKLETAKVLQECNH